MTRARWFFVGSTITLGLAGSFCLGLVLGPLLVGERSTVSRLSPDETLRARLVETSREDSPSRTCLIRLESLRTGQRTVLFRSPEVGQPEGTERLIWSVDGSLLLLVGRHFFVRDNLFLDNGDQLYWLHDFRSGQSWINSAEPSELAPLDADRVRDIPFTEEIRLRPRRGQASHSLRKISLRG